jgi:hypothetical protein
MSFMTKEIALKIANDTEERLRFTALQLLQDYSQGSLIDLEKIATGSDHIMSVVHLVNYLKFRPDFPFFDLGESLAEYILNHDNEREDYLKWCDENGKNPDDYKSNSGHIFAVAKRFMELR